MPSPAWEDLTVFFDDFAVPGVIHFQAGGTRNVMCIFDDPYLAAKLGGYDRDDNHVMALVREVDAVGVKRFDQFEVNGTLYAVMTGPQGDGTGLAIISMNNEPA